MRSDFCEAGRISLLVRISRGRKWIFCFAGGISDIQAIDQNQGRFNKWQKS